MKLTVQPKQEIIDQLAEAFELIDDGAGCGCCGEWGKYKQGKEAVRNIVHELLGVPRDV